MRPSVVTASRPTGPLSKHRWAVALWLGGHGVRRRLAVVKDDFQHCLTSRVTSVARLVEVVLLGKRDPFISGRHPDLRIAHIPHVDAGGSHVIERDFRKRDEGKLAYFSV